MHGQSIIKIMQGCPMFFWQFAKAIIADWFMDCSENSQWVLSLTSHIITSLQYTHMFW